MTVADLITIDYKVPPGEIYVMQDGVRVARIINVGAEDSLPSLWQHERESNSQWRERE